MNPLGHSQTSAHRYNAPMELFLPIHELIDSSKCLMNNNSGRALIYNTFFIQTILPKIFGHYITLPNGRKIDVVDIGMTHLMEDFRGQIPTAQDYLENLVIQPWMNNGVKPIPSVEAQQQAKEFLNKLKEQETNLKNG